MAVPVLALRDVRLLDGRRLMFDGVDLGLEARGRACLVGRNGAGKSTLLRILAGATAPDSGERFVKPGLKIALVRQEPVIDGERLIEHASAGGAPRHAAEAALEGLGLDPARPTAGLSGGEARRAALARAFAEAPDVLLLDEPTNHLDILAIETLEARLGRIGASLLMVSHDRAFLTRATTRCFWLEGRRVRRLDAGFGDFEDWAAGISAADAEEERRLDVAIAREAHWMTHGVTARRTRNEGRRRRLVALRADKAERLRLSAGSMAIGAGVGAPSGRRVIEARKLCKTYGERTLLRDFSTRIIKGDRVAIVGANGAGKTTLVKLLLGEIPPDSGSVRLGSNLDIAYIDQARIDLAADLTLVQALAPLGGDQVMVQGQPRHVAAYARDYLFRDDQLRQPVASLSGGERNRLLLARALARPSNLMVLDEPTNDLDIETLDLLEDVLADYAGTLILVSHDRDFIDRLATSTIALDGRGGAVETPGGWSDLTLQNPGFFTPDAKPPKTAAPRAAGASRPVAAPVKLSFRDARRLAELEARLAALAAEIAGHEQSLADAGLYGRDPAAFERVSQGLSAARSALAKAEDEWFVLEELRERLTRPVALSPVDSSND
ncbi:MAG TPA: ABC-F family ATP-binding cassette domain-containing protein [Caulobacteraceae bacterium]|nr:ABC-F family ATP-binding cassette domain-containing protein [Caulobacteraceae bacterium]